MKKKITTTNAIAGWLGATITTCLVLGFVVVLIKGMYWFLTLGM